MQDPIAFLAQVLLAGGGAAVVAYWLFTTLGTKWLDSRFAQRLEALKHAQAQELERYRYQIQSLFNRISKVQEKEFEVLPQAWHLLQDALGHLHQLTSILQSYPNLDRMSPGEVEHFISESDLIDAHKDELRNADQKTDYYRGKSFWYKLNTARRAHGDFHNYLVYNRIFLTRELFDRFHQVDELVSEALIQQEYAEKSRTDQAGWREIKARDDKIQEAVSQIEQLVQKRLHYEEVV